jgi:hypothetical protein
VTVARSDPGAAFRPEEVEAFRYVGYRFDPATGVLGCRYALDDLEFEERVTFAPAAGDVDPQAVDSAARLVFLLAGVSYYKAAAPPLIEVGDPGLTPAERALLEATYLDGLGEYAFRNGLDLSGLTIVAPDRPPAGGAPRPTAGRPLVPFGGGLDSIVTVEGVRDGAPDAALFVVSREGDRFDAIEGAAAVTALPVVRAERQIDGKVLRSRELGYRNGHVPVTGIISAIAVMAAVLDGRDAVVMSNEWSASAGNVVHGGRLVNHQWSKSLEFEDLFRAALAEALPTPVDYFSWLRPRSELWVADRFAGLGDYHRVFRSCNRAFHIDRALRLDHWCGRCDKCAFIDLILSPFLPAAQLREVFAGSEPLDDPELVEQFRALLGMSGEIKPFECVGDVDECRVAVLLAADRADRAGAGVLQRLADEVRPVIGGDVHTFADRLLRPLGDHRIPERYATADLLG